jgi:hypothetical protein
MFISLWREILPAIFSSICIHDYFPTAYGAINLYSRTASSNNSSLCILLNVWVWNLVSNVKGGTLTEGVWEQGAEENILSEERWSDGRLEKTT